MDKITKLIELTEQKLSLLKELKESLKYESCLYDVREMPGSTGKKKYMLFEIATGKQITFGYAEGLLRWFYMRNVPTEKVYNIEILKP